MLLVEEPEEVAALVDASRESLATSPESTAWSWNHRLEFVLGDGRVVETGVVLDGRGRFGVRLPDARERDCVLTPSWRAELRRVLMRAVEGGALETQWQADPTWVAAARCD